MPSTSNSKRYHSSAHPSGSTTLPASILSMPFPLRSLPLGCSSRASDKSVTGFFGHVASGGHESLTQIWHVKYARLQTSMPLQSTPYHTTAYKTIRYGRRGRGFHVSPTRRVIAQEHECARTSRLYLPHSSSLSYIVPYHTTPYRAILDAILDTIRPGPIAALTPTRLRLTLFRRHYDQKSIYSLPRK